MFKKISNKKKTEKKEDINSIKEREEIKKLIDEIFEEDRAILEALKDL